MLGIFYFGLRCSGNFIFVFKMKNMNAKFKVGDKVTITNYGSKIWFARGSDYFTQDISSYLIGQSGIIVKAEKTQNIMHYAIDGIEGKHAWYFEDQLELL